MALQQSANVRLPPAELASVSRGEQVYRHITEAIQTGELKPGMRLREVELAQWLGMSRTPVREALGRLANEGLIANDLQRGMIIAELDHQMVTELYAMREVLEGTAAGLAARYASQAEIAILRQIIKQDRQTGIDIAALTSNNKLFHQALYRSAHNRYLLKTLSTLRDSMALLGQTTLAIPGRAHSAIAEHVELVSAIEAHDCQAAESAARRHIRAAYEARMQLLFQQRQA